MKAVYIRQFGSPDVLEFGERPDPAPASDEVIVDIVAASVNGADWQVRAGQSPASVTFPHILGRDFSGVVSIVGKDVQELQVGDAVFGVCDVGQEGAYAEKIAIKAAILAKKPAALSHAEAAAMALTGITALSAIEDTLQLKPGERILIQGGAGGVGSCAILLAKAIGAHVITTGSALNRDFLRSLNVDEIIDYNLVDFTKAVRDCDAVFDTVGGEVTQRSFAVLRPGGRAAFIASGPQAPIPERLDVLSLRPVVGRSRRVLERLVELVEKGSVWPPEIVCFGLSDAAAAHRVSQARHLRGKLILEVR